eukprot:CAMPEP_0177634948 /NCGR_PEP_ID=MMETSP0447-20121125/3639_1 /TAXON_ID=0 /ORGANISM="Stygamoeba regulata, Strain BSH-02190019" /LENGTH=80 /DNA_ID=CAMNT_0019136701 /DNA_START=39 /DNA_END=281 /DNA_ORIENTATION=+
MGYDVEEEIQKVKECVAKFGTKQADGTTTITFGRLFDETEQIFESLAGALKAAKRKKVISYDCELLLMPGAKDVVITLPA